MMPFPSEETTPPVTKMYFVLIAECFLMNNFFQAAKVRKKFDTPHLQRTIVPTKSEEN